MVSVMSPYVAFVAQPAELTQRFCTVALASANSKQQMSLERSLTRPRRWLAALCPYAAVSILCTLTATQLRAVGDGHALGHAHSAEGLPALLSLPFEGCCFVFVARLQIDPASLLTPYVKLMGNVIDGQAPPSPPGHSV